ncbi:sensor domain-containing diguanylate cyclase [Rhodoferax sp.]|uniref:sensor domain-containing diguanylate cyclase n=1 Tax=Rhodoferax sp. TaxID=50421 RepID=UPI0027287BF0|nr:sensor domain-containing diguanylate cyclase [Rhodoferax sp.]MDO8319851.1 PAS domain S-box protein [Rhodoferax sp.]
MNTKRKHSEDQRLTQILDVIFKFSAGELTARGTLADDDSTLDGVVAGINILGEELQARVAEAQQARQTLAESEALLRGVFDSVQDGVIVAEAQTRQHRMVNDAMCRMLGYSREELLTMSMEDMHPRKDLPYIAREFERIARVGSGIAMSLPIQRKDGSVFYADLNSGPTTINGVACLVGVFRDITERKQAEEKIRTLNQSLEEKVQQLLATQEQLDQHRGHLEQEVAQRTASLTEAQRIAHLGNWEWDITNDTLSWSDEIYRIFGLAPQQFDATYEAFLNAVHPEDRQLVDDNVREALARQHRYSIEHRILQPDGTLRHVHEQAEVIRGKDGQAISMLGTVLDITGRKQAEQALHDSESRYRNLIETTLDWVWEVDENAAYTYVSPRVFAIIGYQPEELIGKTPFDLMTPEEAERVASLFSPLVASQQAIINLENTYIHKDGHPVVLETSGTPVTDIDGKFCGYRGIDRDITERKQTEQTVIDERNFSNTLIASQPDIFFVLDSAGRYIRWNDKVRDILGFSDALLAARNPLDAIHEADRPAVAQKIQEAFEEGAATIEARIITKMGVRDYVFSATSADTEKSKYLVGVGTDITERKQMETELRESELAYRTLAQNLPGMVYRVFVREGGRMQFYNEMSVQMTGYAVDELPTGTVCSIEPLILDEDRPGVEAEVRRAIAEKRAFMVEYRLKHKDGGIRWLEERGMPVYGTDDTPLYIDGVIVDVTEHKQDEIKLQMFRALLDNSIDAIEVLDPVTMRLLDVNETQCRKLGYSREEMLSMKITDIDAGFTADQMREIGALIQKNGEAQFETMQRRKDDTIFPVEVSTKLLELDKPYLLSIVRDITERKLAEAEVQKLQEQLREQAARDPLTGLFNRRYLDETIARELARAARNNQPVGIVMCDLDHFKLVNDTHGHLAGDEVLRVFAELLKKHARGSDIVCRFGGEEFVMFLPDMSPAVAYQRAEQLRTEIAAQRITLGAAVIQVTASFGVAVFPENGKTMDSLISAVDAAMYQAKEEGRNRVVVSSACAADGSTPM